MHESKRGGADARRIVVKNLDDIYMSGMVYGKKYIPDGLPVVLRMQTHTGKMQQVTINRCLQIYRVHWWPDVILYEMCRFEYMETASGSSV